MVTVKEIRSMIRQWEREQNVDSALLARDFDAAAELAGDLVEHIELTELPFGSHVDL